MTKEIVVHEFRMGDVEDPNLYAAEPIIQWQQSESGQWIMERAVDQPSWHRSTDPATYGYRFEIRAKLKDIDYTYWVLKWG
jgi:hypothetical protein